MKNIRIFIDMDGTLAKWHAEKSIEEVTSPGYFKKLEPMTSMITAIKELIKAFEGSPVQFFIISSVFSDDHSVAEKNEWLDKYLPEISKSNRIFPVYGTNKGESLTIQNPTDILIDDYSKNLFEWHGIGIKVYNGINGTKGTWKGYQISAESRSYVILNTLKGIVNIEGEAA